MRCVSNNDILQCSEPISKVDDVDDEVHLYGAGLHSMECSLRIKKKRGGTKTQTIEQK
jgi:hypothetical protein